MERLWCPPGPERAFSLRIPHLGMRLSFLSIGTIPLLVARFGWRSVRRPSATLASPISSSLNARGEAPHTGGFR
jgi:hypothetical protein